MSTPRRSAGLRALMRPSPSDTDNDGEPPAPLWQPPPAIARLLRWLASLREPRRFASAAVVTSACGLLLSVYRRQAAALARIRIEPVSELLQAVEKGHVKRAIVGVAGCAYELVGGQSCRAALLPVDAKLLVKLLHKHAVPYQAQGQSAWKALAVLMVPFAYLGVCGWMLYRMTNDGGGLVGGPPSEQGQGGGKGAPPPIGWGDVAGLPGVKAAVMEVVDVIHRPAAYARLGARCPRGILLAGPPGTGKTLLARAVAGEAGVPFLCCAGSDFVEVFVGRGAKRVRTLFEEAGRRAPCVLFIDEVRSTAIPCDLLRSTSRDRPPAISRDLPSHRRGALSVRPRVPRSSTPSAPPAARVAAAARTNTTRRSISCLR